MTRKEAVEILRPVFGSSVDAHGPKWIDAFEALGLIKLDEEKPLSEILRESGAIPATLIDRLDRYGYKIVKK